MAKQTISMETVTAALAAKPQALTLAAIRAQIMAAQQWKAAESERIGRQVQEREEAERKLMWTKSQVNNQRSLLVRYEAALAEYRERKKTAEARGQIINPFQWRDSEPLTTSEIDELEAEIPALAQRVAELKGQSLPTGAAQESAFYARLAHLEAPLREMLVQARQQVETVQKEHAQTLVDLRSENDADRLIALRATADQLPLRLTCAQLTALHTELTLIEVVGANRYSFSGYGLVYKLQTERAEWQDRKASLSLGTPVRNVSHLQRGG